MRMVVDLPAPLGPRNPKISPLPTWSETWSTAVKSPNFLTRLSISTAHCRHRPSFWISAMKTSSSDGAMGRNTAGPRF